jgi:superfamily I DNA/RNA helicase
LDRETRWDEGLSGPALEIAACEESPLRVCAGPGTGKSRALRHRIKRLLQEGIEPNHIFLVTFTRNAAAELRKDLRGLETRGADRVVSGTLHSFCFKSVAGGEIPASGDAMPVQ